MTYGKWRRKILDLRLVLHKFPQHCTMLHLTAALDLRRNSIPFFGAVALCASKIDDFRKQPLPKIGDAPKMETTPNMKTIPKINHPPTTLTF